MIPGVGPRESQVLRLCLDAKGYPDGGMVNAVHRLKLDDVLALEAVSLRRREEVGALTEHARLEAEEDARRNAPPGGGR